MVSLPALLSELFAWISGDITGKTLVATSTALSSGGKTLYRLEFQSTTPPSDVSGLAGIVASHAPLLSPRFIGTPTKNGVALATTDDITASSPDSDQNILATQIFGA